MRRGQPHQGEHPDVALLGDRDVRRASGGARGSSEEGDNGRGAREARSEASRRQQGAYHQLRERVGEFSISEMTERTKMPCSSLSETA